MKSHVLFTLCVFAVIVPSMAFPGKVKEDKHVPKVWYGYIGFVDLIPVNDRDAENDVNAIRENGMIFTDRRVWTTGVGMDTHEVDTDNSEEVYREKRELIRDELLQRR